MTIYLPDTNVFSQIFKGNQTVTLFIEQLEIVVDSTVYIECLQGSKSNQEKRIVKKVLDNFSLPPLLLHQNANPPYVINL